MGLKQASLAAMLLLTLAACGGSGTASAISPPVTPPAPVVTATPVAPPPATPLLEAKHMLRAQGTKWVRADGSQVLLKGVNLGNWLLNEFWMMGQGSNGIDDNCKLDAALDARFGYAERDRLMTLFRDHWITTRDWDLMAKFGWNAVRVPFIHTVVEDEKNPGKLRADAWRYLDDAVARAEKRGMYVILDLHGAAGSQGVEHHSGCANRNLYWSTPEYQQRTIWLWQQVAGRYRDRPSVAGYSLLNEPWGTSAAKLATVVETLYAAVRAVDPNHVIILPGHNSGIAAYGNPAAKGMKNVAFEMHFYPGLFGWGQIGVDVHRDWLTCSGGANSGMCEWEQRLKALDTPFFVGELQPWTGLGADMGGQITRATFDAYGKSGWAATAWAWKYVSNKGGQGNNTWGLVTNASGQAVPALDFKSAPLADIENLFRLYGSVEYEPQRRVIDWMTSTTPPAPFAK